MDLPTLVDSLLRLGAAYVLAIPIGFEREMHSRSAGIRTFPLVALASCAFLLIAERFSAQQLDLARVLAGLIAGIGFIGGGAILKREVSVTGLATATSIWIAAAIGVASAGHCFDIAAVLTIVTFFTLRYTKPLKQAAQEKARDDSD